MIFSTDTFKSNFLFPHPFDQYNINKSLLIFLFNIMIKKSAYTMETQVLPTVDKKKGAENYVRERLRKISIEKE